ncbi:DUF433 domain-containing protein [Scytonema sp. NUACC26]|uniref:DUF433 domain-containing protein n=1 Tax=Scytonema sp. NUACC26 TaxID=3140176 RepID=UPI0034DBDE53
MSGKENSSLICKHKHIVRQQYCIKRTLVPCWAIKSAYKGGDDIANLMYDYNLTMDEIVAAITFRLKKR